MRCSQNRPRTPRQSRRRMSHCKLYRACMYSLNALKTVASPVCAAVPSVLSTRARDSRHGFPIDDKIHRWVIDGIVCKIWRHRRE
jgi:hypothetical protein